MSSCVFLLLGGGEWRDEDFLRKKEGGRGVKRLGEGMEGESFEDVGGFEKRLEMFRVQVIQS